VRPAERAVRIDGKPVPIGSRAFDLLLVLIENGGRLVTKDELMQRVWGRTIVEEANLHVQISALRKLLGAQAVTTVPGRGYRFAAPDVATDVETFDRGPTAAKTARIPASIEPPPPLFGRDDDLAALQTLTAAHRLVTIAGPGGIGKTRLARALLWHARDRFPDGVAMIELAAMSDSKRVPAAIAAALQLPPGSGSDPADALAAALRPLRMLILLDNAEQIADGVAAVVARLLDGGGAVHVVVTSQVPLKVGGERVHRLGGLDLPAANATVAPGEALGFGAVALFVERVRAADRHFTLTERNLPHVIAICRALDGIALAIELAAARAPVLGVQVVAERLDARFRLLRSGARTAPSRQQTLEAAMDWSHALLTAPQQIAFRQLGVFAGGFTLQLAQRVLRQPGLDEWENIDLLAELVDRSLVAVDAGDAPRYRLLETARAYALARLAEAEEESVLRRRQATALRALFETAYAECWLLPEAVFVERYEPELDNLRVALDWSHEDDAETAIALAGASSRLWRWLSLHPEALARAHAAAALIDGDTPPMLAARLWEAIAQLSGEISSVDSRPAARRALELYASIGDDRGRYLALGHIAFSFRSATPEAAAAHAAMQAIEDPTWPPSLRLVGTKVAGGLASDDRRVDEARQAHQARLALATEAGSEREVNAALGNLADLALLAGDAPDAVRLGRALLDRLGRRHIATRAIALGNLLLAELAADAVADARRTLSAFVEVSRMLGYMYVVYAADAMALLAAREGSIEAAARLLGYADASYAAQGQPREPNEAHARDAAHAIVTANAGDAAVANWMSDGARLSAEAVCALAVSSQAA